MKHLRTCTLCEAVCGLVVTEEHGRVTDLRGDPDDPFSRGYLCPKALGLKDVHEDPDRLTTPRVREGERWREVSWDEAFERVAAGLKRVQREHGRDAVAVYLGNPNVHNMSGLLYPRFFIRAMGTSNLYSASTIDQRPKEVSSGLMFGAMLSPVEFSQQT